MIDQEGIKSLEKGADNIRLTGNEGESSPAQEIIKAGIPKDMTMDQAFEVFMQSEGRPPKSVPELLEFFKNRNLSRGPIIPSDEDPINPFQPKPIGPVLPDRQMAAFGGIMGLDQRKQYGIGSSFKKAFRKVTKPFVRVAQKLMPKELAGVAQFAAPFAGPYAGPLLMAAGQAKQRGRISPVALAASLAPYIRMQAGEGITGIDFAGYGSKTGDLANTFGFRDLITGGGTGSVYEGESLFDKIGLGGPETPYNTSPKNYGRRVDEFLFGAPEGGFEKYDKEQLAELGLPKDGSFGTMTADASSGIIGKGGEMFQVGNDVRLLETKAGQLAFGESKNKDKLSMLKIGSWGTGIIAGIQAGKYKSEMEAAEAAEAAALAANEAATEADLQAARDWAIATFSNMSVYADGGRINKNMGGEFNMPPAGLSSLQTQPSDVTPPGMELDLRGGGFIPIGKAEKADDVPARVSKNEFVFTADAVKAAGGGSVNEGAKKNVRHNETIGITGSIMAETITNITQPAPIFEEGAKKYLAELTGQTDVSKALDTSKFAPGVAQQSALAQATQQQAAKQAGLGTLAFDPTTGAISGLTPGTGIGGYQQYLDPAAAQAQAAGTTLGNVRGQLTGAQTAAGLAQPLLTQAGQDIGTAATTLGGVSPFISAAGTGLGQAGTTLGGVSPFISAAQAGLGQAGTTLAGTATPLSAAAGLTGTGAGTGTGSIQSYMSPYQTAVRDATLAEYDTQAAAQRSAVTQQAGLGTVGNLDSGRFGVQLGAFDAQQQRDRALIDAQLGQQGFGQASQARQQDLANQLGLAGAQQQFAASQAGLAGQQLGLGQATSGLAQQQAGLAGQQLGLGQATSGLASQQAGLGSQRQQLAASQQQLAGTGLGLGTAEQQLAQQQLGLGQYYGNLAQLQPQLMGQQLAIGQGLAGGDLQYRQAVEDAARQANQMAQFEPLQRLDRFGQGLTGVMGGLGSVQTQTGPSAAAPSPFGSAISSGIGALTMGKLFGLG